MAKILRKLTIKEAIGGKAELLRIAQSGKETPESITGKAVPILTIIGQVSGFLPGESDNGPFLKLKGDFEATNMVTGEVISDVATAILPNFVADTLANALRNEGAQSVDFAIELAVRYEETAATMYAFEARSLMPTQPSRAVSAIRDRLTAMGVALPAPQQMQLAAPVVEPEQVPEAASIGEPEPATKKSGKK